MNILEVFRDKPEAGYFERSKLVRLFFIAINLVISFLSIKTAMYFVGSLIGAEMEADSKGLVWGLTVAICLVLETAKSFLTQDFAKELFRYKNLDAPRLIAVAVLLAMSYYTSAEGAKIQTMKAAEASAATDSTFAKTDSFKLELASLDAPKVSKKDPLKKQYLAEAMQKNVVQAAAANVKAIEAAAALEEARAKREAIAASANAAREAKAEAKAEEAAEAKAGLILFYEVFIFFCALSSGYFLGQKRPQKKAPTLLEEADLSFDSYNEISAEEMLLKQEAAEAARAAKAAEEEALRKTKARFVYFRQQLKLAEAQNDTDKANYYSSKMEEIANLIEKAGGALPKEKK